MQSKHPPKLTAKGTSLPILDLKGKPYLQVAYRVVWFREDHPMGRIETKIIESSEKQTIVMATIISESGIVLANAHKTEHSAHFLDHLEKAETGAIGRALALCGYGTQFEPEMDEGDRIVDSPMPPANKPNMEVIYSELPHEKKIFANACIAAGIKDKGQMSELSARLCGKAKLSNLAESVKEQIEDVEIV